MGKKQGDEMNKKSISILIGLTITIALGICFYYTPHWSVFNMKKAAENKDADSLSEYVDFPSLKESLKANFSSTMASDASNNMRDNPFGILGAALAVALINPMIDNLVTPEGLAMLMKGEKPQLEKMNKDSKEKQSSADANIETKMGYGNFNSFIVTVKKKESSDDPVKIIFKRHGIISWKLSALRLPSTNKENKTAKVSSCSTKAGTSTNSQAGKVTGNKQAVLSGHDIGYTTHGIEELTAKISEKGRQAELSEGQTLKIIEKIVLVYKLEMIQAGDTPKEKQAVIENTNNLIDTEINVVKKQIEEKKKLAEEEINAVKKQIEEEKKLAVEEILVSKIKMVNEQTEERNKLLKEQLGLLRNANSFGKQEELADSITKSNKCESRIESLNEEIATLRDTSKKGLEAIQKFGVSVP